MQNLTALQMPKLDLPKAATAALAGFMVNGAPSKATFTYTYGR